MRDLFSFPAAAFGFASSKPHTPVRSDQCRDGIDWLCIRDSHRDQVIDDPAIAFHDTDAIFLVGSFPRKDEMDSPDIRTRNVDITGNPSSIDPFLPLKLSCSNGGRSRTIVDDRNNPDILARNPATSRGCQKPSGDEWLRVKLKETEAQLARSSRSNNIIRFVLKVTMRA
jgi:hypothetical protein